MIPKEHISQALQVLVDDSRVIRPFLFPFFEVMYFTGCRASEAIDQSLWGLTNPGVIILKPNKGNNSRIFNLNEIPESYQEYLKCDTVQRFAPKYDQLNYNFKQLFIYPQVYIGDKKCTLHLFRHDYAKRLKDMGLTDSEVQDKLGEKSISSVMAYIDSLYRKQPNI